MVGTSLILYWQGQCTVIGWSESALQIRGKQVTCTVFATQYKHITEVSPTVHNHRAACYGLLGYWSPLSGGRTSSPSLSGSASSSLSASACSCAGLSSSLPLNSTATCVGVQGNAVQCNEVKCNQEGVVVYCKKEGAREICGVSVRGAFIDTPA
jgi:hypothetical protein